MIKLISMLSVVMLVSASCNKNEVTPNDELNNATQIKNTRANFEKLSGKWVFKEYLKNKTVPANSEATIEFSKGESSDILIVNGRSFVNLYSTSFTYNEAQSTIQIAAPIGMTKMAGTDEQMKAEREFHSNLQNVKKFAVEGNTLKLYVGEPATEVMFFNQ